MNKQHQGSNPKRPHQAQTNAERIGRIKDIKTKLLEIDTFESAGFLEALADFEKHNTITAPILDLFDTIIMNEKSHVQELQQLKDALEKTNKMFTPAADIPKEPVAPPQETPAPPENKYGFIKTKID
jgi:hypothetical protein